MKCHIIPADQLHVDLVREWNRIRSSHAGLESPFFAAAFTQAVAAERPGVEVAIIEDCERVIAFLPYHRDKGDIARASAGPFTDVQGLIHERGTVIDVREVLRRCRLHAWQFNHLLANQAPLATFEWAHFESPYMDLSGGFAAFYQSRRQAGTKELQETLRKARKLEREFAPLRFEPHVASSKVFEQLLDWKHEQLQRQRRPNCFAAPWVLPLLRRLLRTSSDDFSPLVSALYVGDELAAVNLGLRSGPVLHGWITAYNTRFHKFSPGLILMTRLAQAAESLGIQRIDMGRGDEGFKRSFASGTMRLAEGAVDCRILPATIHKSWVRAKALVRRSRWSRPARKLVHGLQSLGADRR